MEFLCLQKLIHEILRHNDSKPGNSRESEHIFFTGNLLPETTGF